MAIKHDKWLYVHTTTAERAREFFGLLPEAEVRVVDSCFAVRAPTLEQAAKGPLPPGVYCPVTAPESIERFHRCRENA